MQALAASSEPVFAMTGKEALCHVKHDNNNLLFLPTPEISQPYPLIFFFVPVFFSKLVFVSVGASRRENESSLRGSSLLPTPNQASIPMFILLEEPNFTQLFDLLQILRNFISKERKASEVTQITSFSKLGTAIYYKTTCMLCVL